MANRQTAGKLTNKELTFQQHETDSPLIPVAQLERLQTFKPEAVDWVIKQTEVEAELTGLAVVFLKGRSKSQPEDDD